MLGSFQAKSTGTTSHLNKYIFNLKIDLNTFFL